MRVLALVPSQKGHAPGQRGSIELWERVLRAEGISLDFAPFESEELRVVLHQSGKPARKTLEMVRAYAERIKLLKRLDEYDAVFVYREAALLGPAFLERRVAKKKPIIYQLDDPLFIPYRSPSNGYLSYLKFFGKVKEIIGLSKVVIVNSTHIREYASQFNRNIWQVPSVVDTEQFTYEPLPANGAVCIGWSGSASTLQNLKVVEKPLQKISRETVCNIHLIGGTDAGLSDVNYTAQKWSAESEVQDLRRIQIGLVPLAGIEWNKYKFIMKTAQYMALGIVPVGTPMASNPEVIRHGENGFLASADEEWTEYLTLLVKDHKLRDKMSRAAAQDAREKYSLEAHKGEIVAAFRGCGQLIMNVLVTGGAGFVGSHLVDALVASGHRVRIIDSLVPQVHGDRPPEHLNGDAEFIQADLCESGSVRKALDGIEVVYHQAAEVGIAQSMYEIARYVKANALGTAVLLEEMTRRPQQFRKLVVASSHSIYGEGAYRCDRCAKQYSPFLRPGGQLAAHEWEFRCTDCGEVLISIGTAETKPAGPTSIYAISKYDQEQYCLTIGRAYAMPTIAFRYFNVYGTRQAVSNPYTGVCAIFSARLMNDQAPTLFEDGRQSRDFVHVRDIVRANLLALDSDKADYQSINVGTGQPTTILEIAETLARGLGKKTAPDIPAKFREGDIRHCVADISKARDLLGYEPTVSLEEGFADLLDWLGEQAPEDRVATATAELTARRLVK